MLIPSKHPIESEMKIAMFKGEKRGFDLAIEFAANIETANLDERGKKILARFVRDNFSLAAGLAIPKAGPNRERCGLICNAIPQIQQAVPDTGWGIWLKSSLGEIENRLLDQLNQTQPAFKYK